MQRESFIFYRSFYEAIKEMPRDIQGEIYTAIMEYSLYGKETENLKQIAKAVFTLIKPQLDANLTRYESGKKGGRPNQKETKAKPNDNQKETKAKPNVNVNENENVNVNEFNPPLSPQGESGGKSKNFIKPTIAQVQDEINRLGYGELDAEEFWHFYESKNWFVGKNKMKSFSSALVTWHKSSLSKMNAKHKAREKKLPSELIRELQEKQAKLDEEYIDTEANYG